MKKILFIIALSPVFFSCTSNNKKINESSGTTNQTGVQNVNGNIPDTTNTINLSTHKKDTVHSAKDSVK